MLHPIPLTDEEVQEIANQANMLGDLLKKARGAGIDSGNPLGYLIEEIFSRKKSDLYERPVFFQMMFIAADMSGESFLQELEKIKEKIKSEIEEK